MKQPRRRSGVPTTESPRSSPSPCRNPPPKMFHVEHCGTFCFTLPTTSPYAGVPLRVGPIPQCTAPPPRPRVFRVEHSWRHEPSRELSSRTARSRYSSQNRSRDGRSTVPPGNFGALRGGPPAPAARFGTQGGAVHPPNVSTGQTLLTERSFHVKPSWRPETCREVSNEEVKTKCSTWNTLRRDPLRQPPEIKSKPLGSVRNFSFPPGAPA